MVHIHFKREGIETLPKGPARNMLGMASLGI